MAWTIMSLFGSCVLWSGRRHVLMVFDSCVGGLGWRYLADFWLVAPFASIPGFLWRSTAEPSTRWPARTTPHRRRHRLCHSMALLMRWTVLIMLIWTLAVAILGCLLPARDADAMLTNNAALWHCVQSGLRCCSRATVAPYRPSSIFPVLQAVFSKTCGIVYVM